MIRSKANQDLRQYFMNPPQRALILTVAHPRKLFPTSRKEEDLQLAQALGFEVVGTEMCQLRRTPHPATFVGKGWVEKIQGLITAQDLNLIIVDPELTPLQQRNLEKAWKCTVWDRTALILSTFAQRARTAAGKLQVTLASLLYQKSRLVRAWSHLERQRGGFGFLAGPGESQLELDRRMLQDKILKVKAQLEKVRKTRALHRKSRQSFFTVALVGYTNVGKSTLFNRLTHADVLEADMPFATLDPTVRKVILPSGRVMMLSDTVGFISELPAPLRLAFQATLEEILEADLLIHVRDVASPYTWQQKQDVLKILSQMKCEVPLIEVLNKADLLPPVELEEGASLPAQDHEAPLPLSAHTGQGLKALLQRIDEALPQEKHLAVHEPD